MKTGLESLDTGAPNITYSGNQGPKSPQEDQQKMAEFELQEYMEEFERVFPDMKDKRGTPDYMKELQDYFEGLASKQDEGIGNLAMADPLLEDEYQKYVFEMEEQGLQPMSFEEFKQQAMSGMAKGGIMGSNAGSMLVAPTKDGSRPGYYGPDEGHAGEMGGKGFGSGYSEGSLGGGGEGISDAGARRVLAARSDLQAGIEAAKAAKEAERIAAQKEQERIQALLESYRGKTPEAYSSTKFGKVITPYDFGKRQPGVLSIGGLIPTAVNIAKKIETKLANNRIREELGLEDVDEIEMDMPNAPFGRSRVRNTGGGDDREDPNTRPIIFPPITPVTSMETATVPTTPTTNFVNRFAPLTNFNTYDVDQANKNAMIALGADPRMFAADGGRIGFSEGGKDLSNDPNYQGWKKIYETNPDAAAMNENHKQYKNFYINQQNMKAEGGRIGYAGGGITDLRQGYFLGKLVKKVTRAVKKVVKSPIGKAALTAAALYYGPKMFKNKNFMGTLFGQAGSRVGQGSVPYMQGLLPKLGLTKGGGSLMPTAMGGITALSTLPLFMGQDEEEENLDAMVASRAGDVSPFDQFNGITGLRRKVLAGNLDRAQFPFMNQSFYAADGGRIGFANGGNDDDEDETIRAQALGALYSTERPKFSDGGAGLPPITAGIEGQNLQSFSDDETPMPTQPDQMPRPKPMMNPMMARGMNPMMARGMNPMMSMQPRMMAQEGGLMDMGGMEKDYRNEGGFVPIGGQERADDVPARLSKNEFVFTADAVRNAGGGDIDKGAEIMENMMENLEQGGKVSEESQGLSGARAMFATQQRLGEVL